MNSSRGGLIIVRVQDTLTTKDEVRAGHFQVSTDVVIFTILEDALQVLLRRLSPEGGEVWALPGGYVRGDERLGDCAQRTLREQTGLRDIYLEQLYTFGRPNRHPRARAISVAYYALVSPDRLADMAPDQLDGWRPTDSLPPMYLDHDRIVVVARERLEAKLQYTTIGFQLMPEHFTLSELQHVYETICGAPVDKRNFRKRVLAMEHLEATDRTRRNGSHRPARLYRYTAREAIHYLK